MQMQGVQAGIVTPQNLFNGATKIVEAMGFKQGDQFFTDPTKQQGPPPPPPPPPPELLKAQAQIQSDQARMTLERQKAEADVMLTREKIAAERDAALQKAAIDAQTEIEREKIRTEAAVRQKRIDAVVMRNNAALSALRGPRNSRQ